MYGSISTDAMFNILVWAWKEESNKIWEHALSFEKPGAKKK